MIIINFFGKKINNQFKNEMKHNEIIIPNNQKKY